MFKVFLSEALPETPEPSFRPEMTPQCEARLLQGLYLGSPCGPIRLMCVHCGCLFFSVRSCLSLLIITLIINAGITTIISTVVVIFFY